MKPTMLIVMDAGIGNMIRMTPILKALSPDWAITVFGQYPSLDVIKGSKYISKVIDTPDWGKSYDVGVLALWYNGRAKQHSVAIRQQCKQIYRAAIDDPNRTEIDHYARIAKFFGCKLGEKGFCQTKAVSLPKTKKKKIALCDTLNPNGQWDRKRWIHFKKLAHLLAKEYKLFLIGGEAEAKKLIRNEWPRNITDYLGKLSIPQTAFVLQECDLVIGNCSGPVHIAAGLDVTTLILTGSTNVKKNEPLGSNWHLLFKEMDCSPCLYTERWEPCGDWKCMASITVDEVYNKAKELINE